MTETTTTQWVILATLIFNTLLSLYKDARDRQWAREKDERDRTWAREDRTERERTAATLAEGLRLHRAELASKVDTAATLATDRMVAKSDELSIQIAGVQEAAANAYDVGNHSAEKLEAVNAHLENLNQRLLETNRAVERAPGEERRKKA